MEEIARRQFHVGPCLGRGGFGEVYRSTMTSAGGLETEVALKVLLADLDPAGQAVQRLRDEGKLLARLNHPTILKVYDLVLLEGRIGLVAEYVEGEDLGECFHAPGGFPLRALLEAIGEVASALNAAWNAPAPAGGRLELVHRDIKPSNIRISRHGQVKLLDFGIARTDTMDREARTQTNLMVGSPVYMAPERFLDAGVHPGSDVFALGASLYEGIAGERLYEDVAVIRMSAMALDEDRHQHFVDQRLAHLPADLPAPVLQLLRDTLVHDPDDRPRAGDLARRCEELADRVGGASLARWCRSRAWPEPGAVKGPLVGRTITEGTLSRSGPILPIGERAPQVPADVTRFESMVPAQAPVLSLPPTPARRRAPLLFAAGGLVVIALGVVLLGGGAAGLVAVGFLGDEAAPPMEAPADPAPDPGTVAVPAEPAPEPQPEVEEEVEEEPEPEPEPRAAAVRRSPPPAAPAPAAPAGVQVGLDGGVAVDLVAGSTRIALPGRVPPGTYAIEAAFDPRKPVRSGSITVLEGGSYTVTCSARMFRCVVQ